MTKVFSKTKILLFSTIFLSLNISNAQKIWQRDFTDHSFGSRAIYWNAVPQKNGRISIAGTTEETQNERALMVTSVDPSFNISWKFRDTSANPSLPEDGILCVADTVSGHTAIAGSYLINENGNINVQSRVIVFDAGGQEIWNTIVPVQHARTRAMSSDQNGNIYLGITIPYNGYNESYILKYDPSGNLLWNAKYTEFSTDIFEIQKILTDDSSVETGICALKSYNRIVLFKFSQSDGSKTWSSTPFGTSDHEISFGDISWAENGNYLLAYSASAQSPLNYNFEIVHFNGENLKVWQKVFDGGFNANDYVSKVIQSGQQIIVTGQGYKASKLDILTASFKFLDGNLLWSKRKDGNNGDDAAFDLKSDAAGNLYVAGFYETNSWFHDAAVIKYDASGNEVMVMKSAGNTNSEYEFRQIFIDDVNHAIIATGLKRLFERPEMPFFAFNADFSVKKWNLDSGEVINETGYGGTGKALFSGRWVKTDTLGNVYFAGYRNLGFTVFNQGGYRDIFDFVLLKYNASGELKWYSVLDSTEHYEAWPPELGEIDKVQCPVFLINKQSSLENATVLIRYRPDGNIDWQKKLTSPGSPFSQAEKLVISDDNNYFVVLRDHPYMKVMKIDVDGNIIWSKNLDELTFDCNNFGLAQLAVSKDEEVFVSFRNTYCWSEDKVWKLDADGNSIWISTLAGGKDSKDLLVADGLYTLTENRISKLNLTDGVEVWSSDLPFDQYGKKLKLYQNSILLFASGSLTRFNSDGITEWQKSLQLSSSYLLFQKDYFVLTGWVYEASVYNYEGELLSKIKCPECATYDVLYPNTASNSWGNGYRTIGVDVRDNTIYWGGIRNELLHGLVPQVLGTGANTLHLIKYKFDNPVLVKETDFDHRPEINVWPNPTNGIFTIKPNKWSSFHSMCISVTNMNGLEVYHQKNVPENLVTVDISNLPSGMYLVKISSDNNSQFGQISVIH